jgi:hypothetical protein
MKFWYPNLEWVDAAALAAAMEPPAPVRVLMKPSATKKRRVVHPLN